MYVFDLPRAVGEPGRPIRLAVLGTCRICDPFADLAARGTMARVCESADTLYSLGEAKQLIDIADGTLDIPDWLRRFVVSESGFLPVSDAALRRIVASVDHFVVEMSDVRQIRFRNIFFNTQCFTASFLTKHGSALLPWYRVVSQGRRAPEEVIREALDRLAIADREERDRTEALLREVRIETITPQSTAAAIRAISAGRAAKWLFVSHFLVPGAPPASMTDRRLTIDCLQQATAETGTQFFDPSSLVAEAGVRVALYERGEDPFHYADDFRVRIGEAILTKMYGSNAALAEPSQARTAAAAMNPALAALHRGRVAQLGIDGSGLFAYYQTRLDQGRVIGEPDIDVAEIATRFLPRFAGYHVLRAGLGEIAFLLADMGLDTVAFDSDRARHLALQAGAHAMRKLRRWPSGRLDVVRQAFPPKAERETLCIATQGPLPVPEDQEDAVLDTIAGYGAVLFAPRLLLRVRETEAEQETLIEKLRVRGLAWIRDYRPYRAVLCARRDPYASR